jgi:hypothetical protein
MSIVPLLQIHSECGAHFGANLQRRGASLWIE